MGVRGTDTTVYTPWVPRRGSKVTHSVEVVQMSTSTQLEITPEVRNSESTTITPLATQNVTGDGVTAWDTETGILQLLRYKIALSSTGGTAGEPMFSHFRMLVPSWATDGAQNV